MSVFFLMTFIWADSENRREVLRGSLLEAIQTRKLRLSPAAEDRPPVGGSPDGRDWKGVAKGRGSKEVQGQEPGSVYLPLKMGKADAEQKGVHPTHLASSAPSILQS